MFLKQRRKELFKIKKFENQSTIRKPKNLKELVKHVRSFKNYQSSRC